MRRGREPVKLARPLTVRDRASVTAVVPTLSLPMTELSDSYSPAMLRDNPTPTLKMSSDSTEDAESDGGDRLA